MVAVQIGAKQHFIYSVCFIAGVDLLSDCRLVLRTFGGLFQSVEPSQLPQRGSVCFIPPPASDIVEERNSPTLLLSFYCLLDLCQMSAQGCCLEFDASFVFVFLMSVCVFEYQWAPRVKWVSDRGSGC